MNIQQSNNVNVLQSMAKKPIADAKVTAPRLSELWEIGDEVRLSTKSLINKLVEMPEIREDKVDYAKKLVANPDYPTSEQLDSTADILARLL